MADGPTIDWPGKSGNAYHYWIYPLPAAFEADPGNYVFARETKPARWTPIYVGETGDLSERFEHAVDAAVKSGPKHRSKNVPPKRRKPKRQENQSDTNFRRGSRNS